jgi:hypothetical protein
MPVITILVKGEETGPRHVSVEDFRSIKLLGAGGKYYCLLILGRITVHFSAYKTWT